MHTVVRRTVDASVCGMVLLFGAFTWHGRAQGFQVAISDDQIQQAMRDAHTPAAAHVFDDVMARRVVRGDYRAPGGALFVSFEAFSKSREALPAPFLLHISTPYLRALATFVDAVRRYAPLPALTADALNAEGVVVTVLPGENFAQADAIEDVVVRPLGSPEGVAVHAQRRTVEPQTITNRAGGIRQVASGVFYFALSAFRELPLDVICIGRGGNETFRIEVQDLDPLALQR